jgi:outer membrane receptor protein involved in Fe transport
MLRHGPRTGVLAASIGALIASGGVSSTALGQEDEDEGSSSADETVVVTGTRIRRNDYTAVNATTVISADEMRDLGVTSVAEMISQLPSNVASTTATTNTDQIQNFGMEVANLRGLNTASGSRTLVLVDGSRFVPTSSSGAVDLNMIPTALVGRIETVTGGASATYGADAMAGVVNVILDTSVEGIRVDLSFGTDDYGEGDEINLSIGTGFEVLDRRGRIQVGYDHNTTDGIPNCTTREWCSRSLGLLQNGDAMFGSGRAPGTPLTNLFFPDQPNYILTEGMRYTRPPEGMMMNGLANDDPDTVANEQQFLLTAAQIAELQATNGWTTPTSTTPGDFATIGMAGMGWARNSFGTYTFTEDGTGVLPYLDVDRNGNPIPKNIYDFILGQGSNGVSPFSPGALAWDGVPIRSENERDNIFTSFSYDFENGVVLTTQLSYSVSKASSPQNSQSNSNWAVGCILPDNAFLDARSGAQESLRQLIDQRRTWIDLNNDGIMDQDGADAYNPFAATPVGGSAACRPGPWLGQSYLDDDETIERYDFPEYTGTGGGFGSSSSITKDVSPFSNRFQTSENDTTNLRIGARGDLFDGGSWTWDVNMNYGHSNREQQVRGQQSRRRLEMALHSVWDDALDQPVCAFNSTNPYEGVWRSDNIPGGFDVPEFQHVAEPGDTVGEYFTQKWLNFIESSLGDQGSPELAQFFFDSMADGCAPANPFGLQLSSEAVAYAFPTLIQGSENDQLSLDVNFSGEIWRGVGAGSFQMAGGLSWRENETINFADPNPYNARDFDERFSDSYSGITEAADAYVEFDLPLLRDKPGADFLSFNIGYRKTENVTKREEGIESILTQRQKRDIDSWKASMVWRPLDILMVRTTRSADTRAPSAEELFSATRPVLETGANNERATPFRADIFATDVNEQLDFYDEFGGFAQTGGNSQLGEEVSTTQTLGLVFTPTELLSGLSASIDYYETFIKGGVETVGVDEVLDNCAAELIVNDFQLSDDYIYCNNVEFDLSQPDPTQDFILPDLSDPLVTEDPDGGGFGGGPKPAPYPELWADAAIAGFESLQVGQSNPFYEFSNIVGVSPSTRNSQPFLSRGVDISVSYNTQLAGGGNLNARVLVSRALEQLVQTRPEFAESQGIPGGGVINNAEINSQRNVAGQTGSNGVSNTGTQNSRLVALFSNYSPTPRISSNMYLTYRKNAFSITGQVRYIGSGKLSNQRLWYGPGETARYVDNNGVVQYADWGPGLNQTITNNNLPSWTTLNVNFEYDFSRSRMQLDRFESLRVYLNITNIGDRVPDFFSGNATGGINATFFSTQGRQYAAGVRMQF